MFQTLLLGSFAIWFGGFFFYVSFVVPIGNELLGSSFEQGLITREATVPLNYLACFAASCMLLESILTWRRSATIRRKIQLGFVIVLSAMTVWLMWLHPQIDAFVDVELHEIVGDYDRFYWLHRLYLWASTLQWVAGWGWLVCYVVAKQSNEKLP